MDKKIDFIGIGVAKSGTTWVAECMMEHPQIVFPGEKELFFFNREPGFSYADDKLTNHYKGISWYLDQFPNAEKGQICGEFGANYYNDPEAAKKIYKFFPKVKILVILRSPVEMLYSLYWFARSSVRISIPSTFEQFVEKEIFLDRGLYYKHLSKFYDLFSNKNIHLMLLDDVKTNPEKVIMDLFSFLNVDDSVTPTILNKKANSSVKVRFNFLAQFGNRLINFLNARGLKKQARLIIKNRFIYNIYKSVNLTPGLKPEMKPKTRKILVDYYGEDLKKLEKLIQRDLSMWLD